LTFFSVTVDRLRLYIKGFRYEGLICAGLFFSFSMAPSLVPREAVTQGILSGFLAATGLFVGLFLTWLYSFLELPKTKGAITKRIRQFVAAATLLFMIYAVWFGAEWQESQREFLGVALLEGWYAPIVLAIAIPLTILLREVGRLFFWTVRLIYRYLNRLIPARISITVSLIIVAIFYTNLISGTVGRYLLRSLDATFLALDQLIDDDIKQPNQALATGSSESVISWQNLGRQGRRFVASGPDQLAIQEFTGKPAKRPLRIYVGLGASESPDERAELALEEMKRVGAFERSVLVVATPTGTGWIDDEAVDSLEYLHHGDTAIVTTQYSYLMSYVSIMLEPGYSRASAEALFNTVYGHWQKLPADQRPRLYLHGLSLGSSGSEQSMNINMLLGDLIQGAVWSGPSFTNPQWNAFVKRRNPDSPSWLPKYGDGSLVRFTNQNNKLDIPGAKWGPLRLVYLQYASDPITFFSTDLFFQEPEWLSGKRGPDVSPDLRWVPIVTGLQVAFDMIGASALGTGIGHLFASAHYIDAWLAVTEPQGWTEAETARLKRHLEN